jgi:pimeloyl-ACP methyl ester carboxylesterase
MATTSTLQTVTSGDGTTIAYERTGSGPPLVLVHGTTADHTRWEPVLPAFTEGHAVYAMDRRGRGASGDVQQTPSAEPTRTSGSGDAEEYDIDREAEDVVAVVDSIDEPVVLLGHSYGAICSLEAALRSDDVERLVLYEPPLPVGDPDRDTEPVLEEMESLIEAGEREDALVLFLRDIAGIPPAELPALRSTPKWPARLDAAHPAVREERARKAYVFDPGRFEGLETPTLLLLGGETAPLHRNATGALDEALPNGRVVVLPGQAHAAMNTAPDLFTDEVLAFVEESR